MTRVKRISVWNPERGAVDHVDVPVDAFGRVLDTSDVDPRTERSVGEQGALIESADAQRTADDIERLRAFEARHGITLESIESPGMVWVNKSAVDAIKAELDSLRTALSTMQGERDALTIEVIAKFVDEKANRLGQFNSPYRDEYVASIAAAIRANATKITP